MRSATVWQRKLSERETWSEVEIEWNAIEWSGMMTTMPSRQSRRRQVMGVREGSDG